MKVFWGIVAVLGVLAGLLILRGGPVASTPPPASPTSTAVPTPAISHESKTPVPIAETDLPTSLPLPAPTETPKVEPAPLALPAVLAPPAAPSQPAAPAPATAPALTPPSPETAAEVARLSAALGDVVANLGDPKPIAVADAPAPPPTAANPSAAPPAPDAAAPAKITPQADGSVLVDDRFTMRGTGTKDDPYVITWELLTSAKESYQPKLGRKIIPDRLKRLDGKWVRINGYVAFPIMAQSADEMLIMLNQWDGCCIGVPPTPYDAVEVRLKKSAEGEERMRVSGTLKGILRVDPYLVKDWLVSLYLMDEGAITTGQ